MEEKALNSDHPLFGPSATLAWMPAGETASIFDFDEKTQHRTPRRIEKWWSIRDCVKYAIDNPVLGHEPWILIKDAQIFAPGQIRMARIEILEQDRQDAQRP